MDKKWEYTDNFGNNIVAETKRTNKTIIVTRTFLLEEGKSTPRGEYPKLKEKGCYEPSRLCCNYGDGFERCEHMKYVDGGWKCKP